MTTKLSIMNVEHLLYSLK